MKKEIYFLPLVMAANMTYAQSISPSIVNSSGGTASVNGYIMDWSFGEVTLTTTFSTPNLIITQGVLQNDPDGSSNGIHDPVSFRQNIRVYPNPSRDILYLQSENKSQYKYQYDLLDINGKVMLGSRAGIVLTDKAEALDLSGLSAGIYILRVTEIQQPETLTQSYKIQKIN